MADFSIIVQTSAGDFDNGRIGEYIDSDDANPRGNEWFNESLIKGLPNALSDLTQTNPSSQPTQSTITGVDLINGLEFDGVDDFMNFPSNALVVDSDITLLVVALPDTTAGSQYLIDSFTSNPGAELALLATDGSSDFGANFNGGSLTAAATTGADVQTLAFTGEAAGNTSRIFRDGVALGTSTFTDADLAFPSNAWKLGANGGTSNFYDGQIYEMHIWTRALAPSELQFFQLAINEKFGISGPANNFVFPDVVNWEDAPTTTQPTRINPISGAPHKYLLVTRKTGLNTIQVVVNDDVLGAAPSDAALGGDLFTYYTIEHPGAVPFITNPDAGFSSVANITFTDAGHYTIGVTRTGATTGTVVFHFDAQ